MCRTCEFGEELKIFSKERAINPFGTMCYDELRRILKKFAKLRVDYICPDCLEIIDYKLRKKIINSVYS